MSKKCNGVLRSVSPTDKYVNMCFDIMKDIQQVETQNSLSTILYERNYVITFAFHLGLSLKSDFNANEQIIGGEVNKRITSGENYLQIIQKLEEEGCKKTNDKNNSNSFSIVPDFLIHGNHDPHDLDPSKQRLVMEVKTDPDLNDKKFMWDLFKLNACMDEFGFQNAVYLIINKEVSSVCSYLDGYKSKINYFARRKKDGIERHLFFFIQENMRGKPFVYEYDLPDCNEKSKNDLANK